MTIKAIPNNLIQFWHDKSNLPEPFKESHARTMRTYSGFHEIFADDAIAADLMKQDAPYLSEFYEHNRIPSSRGDMARLVLLYRYGGLMIDMSMAFYRPIWDRTEDDDEVVLCIYIERIYFIHQVWLNIGAVQCIVSHQSGQFHQEHRRSIAGVDQRFVLPSKNH